MNNLYRLKGKTIVVTGGSGYIGSVLVDALSRYSCKVIVISRNGGQQISNCELLIGDISEKYIWSQVVMLADIVFHLAGNTSLYAAENDSADSLRSSVLPLMHLIDACKISGRKPRVVYASTATIYGLVTILPVDETFTPKPICNYDLHKLFAEMQLETATAQGVLEGVSLRLSNVYGPSIGESSSRDRGILNRIMESAFQGGGIVLYGDGTNLRDYVFITDVINAFLLAGVSDGISGQSFNIACGVGVSLGEAFNLVVAEVAKLNGVPVIIHSKPWPENAPLIEKRSFVANIDLFRLFTGWIPLTSFNEGIALMAKEYERRLINVGPT